MSEDLRELSQRDHAICMAMVKWIETVRKEVGNGYGREWLPSDVDIWKSRLFWRIRSGKEPLQDAPPRAYSCPWYEVIEEPDRPHATFEPVWISGHALDTAIVCQGAYEIIRRVGPDLVLGYGRYRFKACEGEKWIQRSLELEGEP